MRVPITQVSPSRMYNTGPKLPMLTTSLGTGQYWKKGSLRSCERSDVDLTSVCENCDLGADARGRSYSREIKAFVGRVIDSSNQRIAVGRDRRSIVWRESCPPNIVHIVAAVRTSICVWRCPLSESQRHIAKSTRIHLPHPHLLRLPPPLHLLLPLLLLVPLPFLLPPHLHLPLPLSFFPQAS